MLHPRFLALAVLCSTAAAADPPRPVTVAMAEQAPVVTRAEFTGSVTATRRSRLSPRTAGLIASVKVDAGDRVKAGEVLVELDPVLGELALARIRAELQQARIELADADRLVAEVRELANRGGFAKSEAESRETAARVKGSQIQQLEAQEKEQLELIARHRLIAPYDGVIAAKLADEGEWVQTATPVLDLVEVDRPRFDARVPQEFFARVKVGAAAEVRLDAHPGRGIAATVASVVPVKDPVTRTFLVRLGWKSIEPAAAPGMSGRVVFRVEGDQPVVQVPRDAVVRFPDGSARVWTIDDSGGGTVARARPVELGDSLAHHIQVISGVEPGARVVVRGNEGLQDGQALEVLPAAGNPGMPSDR
jgi:RND family efflux transporter MFP subunit